MHNIDIASLIPHTGTMCLLDSVKEWDDQHIVCCSNSHRAASNPLRYAQSLSVHAGIEYAAQAVAVHGGLLARQHCHPATPRQGMIAVLSHVQWQTDRLDTQTEPLEILAEKLADLPQGLHYRFAVNAAQTTLLQGDMMIALQPVNAS